MLILFFFVLLVVALVAIVMSKDNGTTEQMQTEPESDIVGDLEKECARI